MNLNAPRIVTCGCGRQTREPDGEGRCPLCARGDPGEEHSFVGHRDGPGVSTPTWHDPRWIGRR